METTLVISACVVFGLLIGSFLTVVADRVPRGGSIVQPPSACGACGTRLGPLDLVPVFSWLALRGKCRHCKNPIGIEPIVLELATATIFVLFGIKFGADAALPAYWILGAALVVLTWIDLQTQRLPREISYSAFGLGVVALTIAALANDEPDRIWQMIFGAGIAFVLLGGIYVASRGGLGDGDVRLAPLLGLYLGWLNPGIVPVGIFYGFIMGAVVGVAMMARGSADRRTMIPFGPFLAAGTVLGIFAGQWFVDLIWHA